MFAVVSSVSVAGRLLVAHLDVVHTHEISTVVQVLFEVTVLEDSSYIVCVLMRKPSGQVHTWIEAIIRRRGCTHKILKDQCEAAFCVDNVV